MGISDGRGTCKDKGNGGQMRRIKCTYRVVSQDKAGRKTERSLIREDGMRNDYIRFLSTNPIRSVWKKPEICSATGLSKLPLFHSI